MATMHSGLGGTAGYGENVFSTTTKDVGNDDDGAIAVDITSVFGAGGIDYFGTNYTSLYVNSNGVVSFGAANTAYAPNLSGTTTPTIAAFWSDVNINDGGEIYWDLDPANNQVTITWDSVAPYSGSGTNSFQLVLTSLGNGDFNVEYIYGDINWTNGGSGTAETGYTDGGSTDVALPGSGNGTTLAGYETYSFGAEDPAGTTDFTSLNGATVSPDGTVDGTSGNDTIDTSYIDAQGDAVDGYDGDNDSIDAGAGDDTIDAGAGDDKVIGGTGSDTIDGGDGNDTIYGDEAPTGSAEDLNWSLEGGDATNLGSGFTQNTGTMDVSVTMASTGNNNPQLTVETTETEYRASGETFSQNSAGLLFGQGDGDTASLTFDFAATSGSGNTDNVEDVAFRINDVDRSSGNHWDEFDIHAYDADGNEVAVTFTPAGNDTVSGNTVTAGNANETQDQAASSVLIEIAGPVSQIVIDYRNLDVNTQGIYVTDVEFTTIPDAPTGGSADVIHGGAGDDTIYGQGGDDTIWGDAGADTIYGGAGDDTIYMGAGDVVDGGAGDDLFILDPTNALGGSGSTITIVGDETGETAGDTIDFSGLIDWGGISWSGPESGTATLSDGTVVSFSNIENVIICFTRGTGILTPQGERPVESLRVGDFVVTRDNGAQPIRWIGARTVPGQENLAPVRFARGAFGNDRDLWVSPQHRMFYTSGMATLYFDSREVMVPAKHLVDGRLITQVEVPEVTYYHLLFDNHEVVWGNGALSESFHPGHEGLASLDDPNRESLFQRFPQLRSNPGTYGDTARKVLKEYEARLLQAD